MKVKIGNTVTDAKKTPVCIYLSNADIKNISRMLPGAHLYCVAPTGLTPMQLNNFMHGAPYIDKKYLNRKDVRE